ncbi:MAG: D-alanyl-D-alanine carboxypeptidase family protein [Candidatus Margulisbacteria bacterium]|nr:D-alanyl-D-alanine carboxypeptidase family protein [Candidatus Margulisiibacteriota bacterium]
MPSNVGVKTNLHPNRPILIDHTAVKNYEKAIKELNSQGITIEVNKSFRTASEQEALREKYGNLAAPAGSSTHEAALSIDINYKKLTPTEKKKVVETFAKHGFNQHYHAKEQHHFDHKTVDEKKERNKRSSKILENQKDYKQNQILLNQGKTPKR